MINFWFDRRGWWFGEEGKKQLGPFPTWEDLLVSWFQTKGQTFVPQYRRQRKT